MIIRSGGQSGVDRAALDFAIENGLEYSGWCPKGGWAEDYPESPGLLVDYPNLKETPKKDTKQRTVWNVRDSDATLIIDYNFSPGTDLTIVAANKFKKPHFVYHDNKIELKNWIKSIYSPAIELNIGGPRESEMEGIYELTKEVLDCLLKPLLTK